MDKVVINMSINSHAAGGAEDAVGCVERGRGNVVRGSLLTHHPSCPPYGRSTQITKQHTRHSVEIAGRVIKAEDAMEPDAKMQKATVSARLELGSQFNIDDGAAKNLSGRTVCGEGGAWKPRH